MNKKDAERLRQNVINSNKKKTVKKLTPSQVKKKYFTKSEFQEQNELCQWIKKEFPEIYFTVDIAGMNLSRAQRQIYSQRAKKGNPDIMIHEWCRDLFVALDIEFKKTDVIVNHFEINKNTEKGRHLKQQHEVLMDLRKRHHCAVFVSGVERAKKVISLYMDGTDRALKEMNKYIFPQIDFKKIIR